MFERTEAGIVFWAAEWFGPGRPEHLPKQPVGYSPLGASVDERRRRAAEVGAALLTVHPNPGPRSEAEKGRRREARKARRKRRREVKARAAAEEAARGVVVKDEMVVVTWNVQGMSVENLARRKL